MRGMCECCRRLLALLRIVERGTGPFGPVGDDAVLDAWFGRYSPIFEAATDWDRAATDCQES